ncbi:MAG: phosphoserine transaminase, partial [Desulfobulbia bacterium]
DWATKSNWVDCLANVPATRSNTSVCLIIISPEIRKLSTKAQSDFARGLTTFLDKENVAYDIGAYRDAPPGLRIWTGATVEKSNLEKLLPWLDWAYEISLETLGT